MKRKALRFGKGFNVVLGNKDSQAAQMVLQPGKSEGNVRNRHAGADQWLFVVSGSGVGHGQPTSLSVATNDVIVDRTR